MSQPKEYSPLFATTYEQQKQLNAIFIKISKELTLNSIKRYKAHILLLSEWLFSLSSKNSDLVLAQALTHPDSLLPQTNQSFIAGLLAAKFSHQLNYHGHHAKALISAALTTNISLLVNKNGTFEALYQHKKLTPEQLKFYQQYPRLSAQFLSKYNVIDKSSLLWILGHKERLDGSGFPSKLKHNKLSTNAQLLGLISHFAQLTSPRANKAPLKLKPLLIYFLKHQHHFDISLIQQLIVLVDKPLPSFIYKLNKTKYALIIDNDLLNDEHTAVTFSVNDGELIFESKAVQKENNYQQIYMPAPNIISTRTLTTYLRNYVDEPLEDSSDQTQRLKPNSDLSLLLSELNAHLPDKNIINELINKQPTLGERLIHFLQSKYPTSQFNSSYHAMQMIGFNQVNSVLSRIALDTQLSHFQFLTAKNIRQKIDCALNISNEIGGLCRHILPSQLAMFTQLNLAPLYLEHRIINSQPNAAISFEKCHLHHGFSLMGINNTHKQQKVSMALTKIWAPEKSIMNAMTCISTEDTKQAPKERELVAGFELAIYLTHSVFHGIDVINRKQDNRLIAIMRDLKVNAKAIAQLQQTALTTHPYCPL